ncbi:S8 family serine peptidase [Hamadaea tsunoensis]|uniref:S8 family serine peptidase n=1 Tax=Hamadaea tsunoensis TaxID=53368 RepID=UPI00040E269F|nr:S8 family serine peptidase [Hamadaea tsunoensis]
MADQSPSEPWSAPPPSSPLWHPPGLPAAPSHVVGGRDGTFRPGGPAIFGAIVVGLLVLVCGGAFVQAAGWLTGQTLLELDLPQPPWVWPLYAVGVALFGALPALLLMLIPRAYAVREAGRAWFFASVFAILACLLRAIPIEFNEAYLGGTAAVAAVLAVLLRRTQPDFPQRRSPAAVPLAVLAGAVVLVPWLVLGALGGVLETVLAVLAAAAVGWLASSILDGRFWLPFAVGGRTRLVLLGGLVAGIALALVASGTGASGTQLLAFAAVPPLGFAAAALAPGSRAAVGWLTGLAVLGPLAFSDPDEISLFLLGGDIPYWLTIAAVSALVLALIISLVYVFTLPAKLVAGGIGVPDVGFRPARRGLAAALALVALAGGGTAYALAGQPGFHGERLFVVMKQQAPLSGLPLTTGSGPGRTERVSAVYHRLVDFANSTQADLRKQLDRFHLTYTPYYLVNGIAVDGGPEIRAWLSRRDDVDRVLLDPVLRPLPAPLPVDHGDLPRPTGTQWNIAMVGAPQAWQDGVTGQGITVGTSDSGVDGRHEALASGFRGGDDSWYDPWEDSTFPQDHNGHGTHTIATAVGRGGIGVAPGAQWVGCVNLDRNMGSPSYYLDCLQFMLAPFPHGGDAFTDGRPDRAPNILTNSWGCPELEGCDARSLEPAIDALAAAGIAVVVAAGNSGPRCDSITDPPAPYRSAITVAAVNRDKKVASFSSRGAAGSGKPDVAAPGEGVVSAFPGDTYAELDGTSMATPHVAGLIALLWSKDPALIGDLDGTRRRLAATAVPVTGTDTTDAIGTDCANVRQAAGAGIVRYGP